MSRHTPSTVKTSHPRGPNLIEAHHQRLESADGKRWALGRRVKKSLPFRRYESVEIWTLKQRNAEGKVVIVDNWCDRTAAEVWVEDAAISEYDCDWCGRIFPSPYNLSQHQQTCTQRPD